MICVVLSAGISERFGEDKVLVELCGRTLIERVVDVAMKFGKVRVVVNPKNRGEISRILEDVEIVVNESYEDGISTSIKKGIDGVDDDVLVFLADMPLLKVEDVERFLEVASRSASPIVFPTWNGKKGFPTLIRKEALRYAGFLEGDEGFRRICRDFKICEGVEIEGEGFYTDIDTIEDLRRIRGC